MWLEDDEIKALLAQNSAEAVSQVLEAILLRWDSDDDPDFPRPFRGDLMHRFKGDIPNDTLKNLLKVLLVVDQPTSDGALKELAGVVLHSANMSNAYDIALELKIDVKAIELVDRTLKALHDQLLEGIDAARIDPVCYFLSCLLDGAKPIRETVIARLVGWKRSQPELAILRDVVTKDLTVAEQAKFSGL